MTRKYDLPTVRSVLARTGTAALQELLTYVFRAHPKFEQVVANAICAVSNERIEKCHNESHWRQLELQPEPRPFRVEPEAVHKSAPDRSKVN